MQNAECKVQNDNASRHIIAEKSFEFAVRIVNLSKYLMQKHNVARAMRIFSQK